MAKVDRKKLLNKPDEFQTFTDRAYRWAKDNLTLVIVAIGGVALIIALVVGIKAYGDYQARSAANALAPAMAGYSRTLMESSNPAAASQAEKALLQVIDEYGSTTAGRQARFALGCLYLEHAKWQKAQAQFEGLIDDSGNPPELMPLIWRGKGQALEGQGKYKQAADALAKAIELAGPNLSPTFQMARARNLIAAGDKEAAKRIYEGIIARNQDKLNVSLAQAKLVSLGIAPPRPAAK